MSNALVIVEKNNLFEIDEKNNLIEIVCVSNLTINVDELNRFKNQIRFISTFIEITILFSITFLNSIFLNKFDIFMHIEKMTFLNFFFTNATSFNTFKLKKIDFFEYYIHLMQY